MNLSKMKSNLKMNNLYFSSCSVERACKVENGECKADLHRNRNFSSERTFGTERSFWEDMELGIWTVSGLRMVQFSPRSWRRTVPFCMWDLWTDEFCPDQQRNAGNWQGKGICYEKL